ncbi:carboxypeptidase-like regulatory domain-containing protein [Paludisphaera soli]|uniref:carboxypeptidase-like regulatory domain-containing protein n=1 Tax=Paludisphaera soli TaxID=2712865 RepID=UPI0013EA7D49|nr:carboxypeptidase-like regulatory domain-containing protein [Paludisphaera soli]
MNLRQTTRRLAPVAILLGLAAGCGDADDSIALVPVKGKVLRNGEPLGNASVSFQPDPSNADQTPGGDTSGPAGTYLARFKTRSGLAPGKYKVTVTPGAAIPDIEIDASVEEAFKDDPIMLGEMKKSAAGSSKGGRKGKKLDPPAEFEAEVKADGKPLDFDIAKGEVVKQAAAR